jgi:multiple sugar transport system substrate-binding protein
MRRRTRSTALIPTVGALTGALLLVGCGGGSGGGGGSQEGDTTTLTWQMWSGSEVETEALDRLSEMVTEQHPDLTLELRTSTFPDYWTRLAAQASGGDTGCILGVQGPRAPSIEQLLVPLDAAKLEEAGIDLAEFEPAIVEGTQVGGTQVAIPYDLGPLIVYYNTDLFAAAGVPTPALGWTLADFEAAARALTADGRYGFTMVPTVDQVMAWSLTRHGVQPVTEDGTLAVDSPEMVETITWLQGLTAEGVMPPLPATDDTAYALNEFVAGQSAMVVDGPWQLGFVGGEAAFEAGIVPMPAGEAGSATSVAGSGFGVSAECPYPEEALRAIAVLTGPEAQQYLAESGRAFPSRPAQQQFWFRGELAQAEEGLTAANETGVAYRSTKNWTQVSQVFQQNGIPALNGQQTAEEFLGTVQSQTEAGSR